MSTFVLAFVFFLIVVTAMSVGYWVQQKTISGSCGGLGTLGIEKACDCPEPCDRRKARQEKQQVREAKLAEWQKSQIF